MTYKSINTTIQEAVDSERLVMLPMEFDSDDVVRTVLLHPKLLDDMTIKRPVEWSTRIGRLRADFEMFARGQHISLSMTPFEHKSATMGLLDPPSEGNWEFRSRDPRPGIRVFGKFPCVDIFVALHWEPRSVPVGKKRPLGRRNSIEYQLALIKSNELWQETLPELPPIIGGRYSDYVSHNSSEV